MTDLNADPLALRHGPLIAQIWEQIGEARMAALKDLSQDKAAFWLRRIRHFERKALIAHRAEMTRPDASKPVIDGWFRPVTEVLSRAEAHFQACIEQKQTAQTQNAAAVLRATAQAHLVKSP